MEGLRNGKIITLNKTAIRNNNYENNDNASRSDDAYGASDEPESLSYIHIGDLALNTTNDDIYEFYITTAKPDRPTTSKIQFTLLWFDGAGI